MTLKKSKRPHNWVVVNTTDGDGPNRLVLLEINPNKENVEFVHWHYIDVDGLNRIKSKPLMRTGSSSYCLPSRKRLVPFPALSVACLRAKVA